MFLVGLFIGCCVGIFISALLGASKDETNQNEQNN